jgi:hypothetical protein
MENRTLDFLGDAETWNRAHVVLDDIHGLWGGKRITVYGDGTAYIKIVDLAQNEETYRLELNGRGKRVFQVLTQTDILSLAGTGRERRPEEAYTTLILTNAQGATQKVIHWEADGEEPRFESVRATLLEVYDNMRELGATLIGEIPGTIPANAPMETVDPAPAPRPAIDLPQGSTEMRSPLRLLQATADFLTSDSWAFEQLPERPILRMPFQGKSGRWTCYAQVRVTREVEQLLFYSVLPLNIPEDKRLAVAEFLTRANYGMALGNFELDFSDGEVRYKTSVDATDVELTTDTLRPMIYTNVLMMDKYMPGIMSVMYADVSPAEAVKQIEG